METIVRKVNDFYKTKYAVILFAAIGTFFGVIEIVLFATGNLSINGISLSDDSITTAQLWTTLIAFALSLVSLYFGFFIGIANTNKSSRASTYSMIGMILAIVLDLLAGLMLISLELIMALPLVVYRKNFWNNERYKEDKFHIKKMWPWLIALAIACMTLFYGMVLLWGEEIYNFKLLHWMPAPNGDEAGDPKVWKWYFDASVAWMGIMGSFCFLFRWRQAYFWWSVCKVPQTILFIVGGLYVQASQQMIWFLIDMGTVLALTHQLSVHKKEKEANKKEIQ